MTARVYDRAPATLPLMLKAALPALPLVGGLPGVRHTGTTAPGGLLERRGVVTDREHLETYNEVCGFARGSTLPPTYPHMAAFGLHMALMTDTAFPFVPMGLVHLRNRITQHRPIGVDETFDVAVGAADLRPHPKGRLIDVVTTVAVEGEVVWDEVTTLFSRGKGSGRETTEAPLAGVEAPEGVVHWKLAGDLGRRYGAVSGDRNPIHLYPLTAKAFGFPSNIAHGMWTKAQALATLQNKLPDAFTVDVEFKKPILLPATVVFGSRTSRKVTTFGVRDSRKPATHLVGRVTPRK
ncbi:MaoC-like protein [Aeromicrobium marinum DSM 15272]|uniref:MaoC-like protein n=1 Tax=Aeromicrobium marinum DSM 15272 TaxID=585531 RepID=E2SA57_9ACTN|nr:MaoC/PaaZ C-terminal domain-containing protein [Aeromicrobium marinum]EFQ84131.1 MaoC-like protein [Aeromicrobium marinum DSM 15272]